MRILILVLMAVAAFAQPITSTSGEAKKVIAGPSLPTHCNVSDLFFKTVTPIGVYQCKVKDQWTALGGSGGITITTGSGNPSASCTGPSSSNLAVYGDTTGNKVWLCTADNHWEILFSSTGSGGSVGTFSCIAAGSVSAPSSGQLSFFCDASNSNHFSLKNSSATVFDLQAALTVIHSINAGFSGGGSVVASAAVTYFVVPYACTLSAWNISVDTGTAQVDVWKIASGTAIPTSANKISGSTAPPAIASGTSLHSTTFTGWSTTTVTKNDIVAFSVAAVSAATLISVQLECSGVN